MSLCQSGMNSTVGNTFVNIEVLESNPLIHLCNAIDWKKLGEIVENDIKTSPSKLNWWLGCKLNVRINFGVFILQAFLKQTGVLSQFFTEKVFIKCFAGERLYLPGIFLITQRLKNF